MPAGLVIVQVERIAERGSLSARDVKIPGILVDCVVVAAPEHHWQTMGAAYTAAFSGEMRVPVAIGRRRWTDRAQGNRPPRGDGAAARQRREPWLRHPGGHRQRRRRRAHPRLPHAHRRTRSDGRHAGRRAGFRPHQPAGRHRPARAVRLLRRRRARQRVPRAWPRSTAGQRQRQPLRPEARRRGWLHQHQPERPAARVRRDLHAPRPLQGPGRPAGHQPTARSPKFVAEVEQRTFSGDVRGRRRPAGAVRHRALRLPARARRPRTDRDRPGVDLETDVLARMGFEPIIRGAEADGRADLRSGADGLKDDLLVLPLEARFSYDETERTCSSSTSRACRSQPHTSSKRSARRR